MPEQRFLTYQPIHGFGVELFLLGTAFTIAATLGRTLIIPPMPDLETTNYRRGLDHYFVLDTDLRWISTPEFLARYGPSIDTAFQVLPEYREEYASPTIRALHPVWTDCIEHLTGFKRMGFDLHQVVPVRVSRRMALAEIATAFACADPVIALSFINGITHETTRLDHPPIGIRIPHVPTIIREQYASMAQSIIQSHSTAAIHWRRQYHIKKMAKLLENGRLPTAKQMMSHVPSAAEQLLVASDTRIDALRRVAKEKPLRRFRHPDPQVNVVVDIALCANARWFIGTYASTFSFYVAYMRSALGAHAESTILL
jgi:hypothetical protein